MLDRLQEELLSRCMTVFVQLRLLFLLVLELVFERLSALLFELAEGLEHLVEKRGLHLQELLLVEYLF
jgi:hypothetical protein